jgi:hypothetical protein
MTVHNKLLLGWLGLPTTETWGFVCMELVLAWASDDNTIR